MKLPEWNEQWSPLWKECWLYDQMEFGNNKSSLGYTYAYRNRFEAITNAVLRLLPAASQSTILDIAAAQGNFSLFLAERGYRVVWNDLREALIPYVQLKYEHGNIDYRPGNAFEIALNTKMDGVIITEIIEHVAHPNLFLQQVASLVKEDGFIFMSTPLGSYFLNRLPRFSECADPSIYESKQFRPNSDGHIFLLYKDEITMLAAKAGLEIVYMKTYTNPISAGHIKTHYLLKWMPINIIHWIETCSQKLPEALQNKLHSNITVVFKKKKNA